MKTKQTNKQAVERPEYAVEARLMTHLIKDVRFIAGFTIRMQIEISLKINKNKSHQFITRSWI